MNFIIILLSKKLHRYYHKIKKNIIRFLKKKKNFLRIYLNGFSLDLKFTN